MAQLMAIMQGNILRLGFCLVLIHITEFIDHSPVSIQAYCNPGRVRDKVDQHGTDSNT